MFFTSLCRLDDSWIHFTSLYINHFVCLLRSKLPVLFQILALLHTKEKNSKSGVYFPDPAATFHLGV